MSRYRAENFITASSLQPQDMLQISAHLNVPGLRSIFEGGGGLNVYNQNIQDSIADLISKAFYVFR